MTVSDLARTRFAYSPLVKVGEGGDRTLNYLLTVTG